MSYVVLVGGAHLAPIVAFLERELRIGTNWSVDTLAADDMATLWFRASRDPLPRLMNRLDSGELASVSMIRKRPSSFLVGLYRPRFGGEPPNQWRCILEGEKAESINLYEAARRSDGVGFVSLSVDEAPEFTADDVSMDNFPWDEWRLLCAAVRSPSGTWEERSGPAR